MFYVIILQNKHLDLLKKNLVAILYYPLKKESLSGFNEGVFMKIQKGVTLLRTNWYWLT